MPGFKTTIIRGSGGLQVLDPDDMERRNPHDFVVNAFISMARNANVNDGSRYHQKVAVRHIVTLAIPQADSEGHKRLCIAQFPDVFRSHENTLQFAPNHFNSDCRVMVTAGILFV
jgi:hypothetical protein